MTGTITIETKPGTIRAVLQRGSTRRVFNAVTGPITTPAPEPKYAGWYCLTEWDANSNESHSWHAIGIDPDKIDLDPNSAWLLSKITALEARLAEMEGKPKAPAEPPPALAALREEGETLDQFRQRMRTWRAQLHSQMMGAREGVGEFPDNERKWLEYLETVDWLGA